MERERLKLEKIILDKYFKGLYHIEKAGKNDYTVGFRHKEFVYSIIALKNYPMTAPLIAFDEETGLKLQADESFSHKVTDLSFNNGVFLLDHQFADFTSNWTFYKIIGIVNAWLDNDPVERGEITADATPTEEPSTEVTPAEETLSEEIENEKIISENLENNEL